MSEYRVTLRKEPLEYFAGPRDGETEQHWVGPGVAIRERHPCGGVYCLFPGRPPFMVWSPPGMNWVNPNPGRLPDGD